MSFKSGLKSIGGKLSTAQKWTNPVGIADEMFFKPSRERKAEQDKLASRYFDKADATGEEISAEKSKDPFQSAYTKAAMAKVSRNAKQMQNRTLNTLGAGASPEALVAQQGKTTEAVGSAAGQIATGAEAQKMANISGLRGNQAQLESMATNAKTGAINETGQGWKDFWDYSGKIADTTGKVASAIGTGGAV